MATRPEVVRHMLEFIPDSCSGGQGHSDKHVLLFLPVFF